MMQNMKGEVTFSKETSFLVIHSSNFEGVTWFLLLTTVGATSLLMRVLYLEQEDVIDSRAYDTVLYPKSIHLLKQLKEKH